MIVFAVVIVIVIVIAMFVFPHVYDQVHLRNTSFHHSENYQRFVDCLQASCSFACIFTRSKRFALMPGQKFSAFQHHPPPQKKNLCFVLLVNPSLTCCPVTCP